jgi:hypothetical protein
MPTLLEILPEDLRDSLTEAETTLLQNAGKGVESDFRINKKVFTSIPADYCLDDNDLDNPKNSSGWGPERTIRVELLFWLFAHKQTTELVHANGINIIGAKVEGYVDFLSATLPRRLGFILCAFGDIILIEANTRTINLSGSSIKSLTADGLVVNGALFLRGVKTKGEVRLTGANISGQLSCSGAEFGNEVGDALAAAGLVVKGNVNLRGVKTKSEVQLTGANISGQLNCSGVEFEKPGGYALLIQDAQIGSLLLREVNKLIGHLGLINAHVGTLVDDETSWPNENQGKLNLIGFEYGLFFGTNTPITAEKRLKWLRLQDPIYFSLQPYEQLAKVFRQMGHESDAREVQIAKNYDLRRYGKLSWHSLMWNKFLGFTVGYGYQPWRAVLILAFIATIGMDVFWFQSNMLPTKERVYMDSAYVKDHKLPREYPEYNAFVYSLDTLIPVLNLHQEDYFIPKAGFYRGYLWFHIICGWILTTLGIASLTGLIKKE